MNLHEIIFLMMYIFVLVYLCIKKLHVMTSSFVCATLNFGRKKSTGTERILKICVPTITRSCKLGS